MTSLALALSQAASISARWGGRRRRRRVRREGERGGACRRVSTSSREWEERPSERGETARQDEAQSSPPTPPPLSPQQDANRAEDAPISKCPMLLEEDDPRSQRKVLRSRRAGWEVWEGREGRARRRDVPGACGAAQASQTMHRVCARRHNPGRGQLEARDEERSEYVGTGRRRLRRPRRRRGGAPTRGQLLKSVREGGRQEEAARGVQRRIRGRGGEGRKVTHLQTMASSGMASKCSPRMMSRQPVVVTKMLP